MGLSVNRRRTKIVAVDAKSGQALVRESSEWKDIMEDTVGFRGEE
jgi:hypothetical protein